MSESTSQRKRIIEIAGKLFREHGYAATSMAQIAEAVGLTKATLYHYFRGGKEAILHEAMQKYMPNMMNLIESAKSAISLHDLILEFGQGITEQGSDFVKSIRWVIAEYPNFGPNERKILHEEQLKFHAAFADLIEAFVGGRQEAEDLAWLILYSVVGYGQFFIALELQSFVNWPWDKFIARLASTIAADR